MNTPTVQPPATTSTTRPFEVDPTLPPVTFARAVSSEFGKLLALRTTWWLSGVTLLLGLLIGASIAFSAAYLGPDGQTDPVQLAEQGLTGVYFAMILLGSLGVIAITTEFTSGAIRSSLTAVPQRSMLIGAKALALAMWSALVTAVLVLGCHLVVAVITEPLTLGAMVSEPEVALVYLTSWAAVVLTSVMGFGLGALLRSSAGAIVTLAAILFVVQIALSIIWGVSGGAAWAETLMRVEYMFLVGEFSSQSAGAEAGFGPDPLQRWQAGLGMLVWVAVPLVAGWLSFLRRDS